MRERVARSGRKVAFTRATGITTKPITLVDYFIKMGVFIKVNGKKIRLTALAFTNTRMALFIEGSGRMTHRMEMD